MREKGGVGQPEATADAHVPRGGSFRHELVEAYSTMDPSLVSTSLRQEAMRLCFEKSPPVTQ